MRQEFTLSLPSRYRRREVFAFHARDPEALTENVGDDHIRKGVVVAGAPAVLDLEFGARRVTCRLEGDAASRVRAGTRTALQAAVAGMLGLHADPAPCEAAWRGDKLIGAIVARQPGLRIPVAFSAFEALSWAVIGQQINLAFAIQLRRTVVRAAGRRHSSGQWCYPEAADVARLRPADLCALKFSRAKAETLVRVAQLTVDGTLPLDCWRKDGASVEEMETTLLAVKGIGPWTVNYVLLRGFGLADRSLHGDAAVRAALQRALGASHRIDEGRARELLERYRPWRSYAAAHLWASLHTAP